MKKDKDPIIPFDPAVDIQEVEQFGFVDLCDAYVRGSIPGSLDSNDESFTGASEAGALMHSAQDVFEAMRNADYVQSALASKDAAEKAVAAAKAAADAAAAASAGGAA